MTDIFSIITEFIQNKNSFQAEIDKWMNDLYPFNRTLLSRANETSNSLIKTALDVNEIKVPSGDEHLGWKVPKQRDFIYGIVRCNGEKLFDSYDNHLHFPSHIYPVKTTMNYKEFREVCRFSEVSNSAIPYVTTYYTKDLIICMSKNQFDNLDANAEYEIEIKSVESDGYLQILEKVIGQNGASETLISSYNCHPSLANDSLSGVVAWIILLSILNDKSLNKSYRFVMAPETLGAICYLSKRRLEIKEKVKYALVLTTLGGDGNYVIKQTFEKTSYLDKAFENAMIALKRNYETRPFSIDGSDERQFSSPLFRIPAGGIYKGKYHEYKEYHTSLDDLNYVNTDYIYESILNYLYVISLIEVKDIKVSGKNGVEPFLSKYNLYPKEGRTLNHEQDIDFTEYLIWVLFYRDNSKSLGEIAIDHDLDIRVLFKAYQTLKNKGIIC